MFACIGLVSLLGFAPLNEYAGVEATFEIYVNPTTGNDANPGTEASPVATLGKAGLLIPSEGSGIIHLSAGNHALTDYASESISQRTVLKAKGYLIVQGTTSVEDTFTIDSVSENVLTASGSPGWSVDEHVGRFVRQVVSATVTRYHWILSNTSDTLTVSKTPASLGGSGELPGSGDMDIESIQSWIIPSATNPTKIFNRLYVGGNMRFLEVGFDGTTGNTGPTSIDGGGVISFYACKFQDWSSRAISLSNCETSVNYTLFDTVGTAIESYNGRLTYGIDNVLKDVTTGVILYNGYMSSTSVSSVWADTVTTVFHLRDHATFWESHKRVHLTSVTTYAQLEFGGNFARNDNAAVLIWSGTEQPDTVISMVEGDNSAILYDTANSTMTGTSEYVDMGGVTTSHTDYVASPSLMDAHFNKIADVSAAAISVSGRLSNAPDEDTIADSGDGNPATHTLTPTSSVVELTCSDSDTCDITMGESGISQGTTVAIFNVGSNVIDFADSAGVLELNNGKAYAMGAEEYLSLYYNGSAWVEKGRSVEVFAADGKALKAIDLANSYITDSVTSAYVYQISLDSDGLRLRNTNKISFYGYGRLAMPDANGVFYLQNAGNTRHLCIDFTADGVTEFKSGSTCTAITALKWGGLAINAPDSDTIADTGTGDPATHTLTPTSSVVQLTCNDADTCDITMGETGMVAGTRVLIVSMGSNTIDFADSAGVLELDGGAAFAMTDQDSLELYYTGAEWIELRRMDID